MEPVRGRTSYQGPPHVPSEDALPLQWDVFEYLPVTVQDVGGEVLMIQYMTEEGLARTLDERSLWLWSRSRATFWMAGRNGGGYDVVDVRANCMGDSLLAIVDARGRLGCHLGNTTCFTSSITEDAMPRNEEER
jgi:phosphoribosyl-AMP cyclohydrolase